MFTGTDGYTDLLLLIKGGNSFATFLVSGTCQHLVRLVHAAEPR